MLEINNLAASRGGKTVFQNVSLELMPNTMTVLIGKNGCGKSTLCECINHTLKYSGEIKACGRRLDAIPARERARLISFLPQKLCSPHITVQELIALGRSPYHSVFSRESSEDCNAVISAAEKLGIRQLLGAYVDEISGGERQKAYLAMMLAQNADIMVLDEPTAHMDISYEHLFMKKLTELKNNEKKTVLVVMHDINTAIKYADRIAVMDSGGIVFCGESADCIASGVIERVFAVKKYSEGENVFYTA